MTRLRNLWRRAGLVAATALGWATLHGTALAQAAQPEESGSSGGRNLYLASYGIVLLGIGLGLLTVCNSSRRRDRAKPEQYGE